MKNLIISSILMLALTGCSKKIIPNYTTVQEIYNLKKGYSMDKVNSTLGVGPYEFYTNFNDGNKVLVYKYKKQYQLVPINQQDSRESLSGGSAEKFKNEGDVYVIFDQKSNDMVYYITDSGRKLAKGIINQSNQLKLIKQDPTKYKELYSAMQKNDKFSFLKIFSK